MLYILFSYKNQLSNSGYFLKINSPDKAKPIILLEVTANGVNVILGSWNITYNDYKRFNGQFPVTFFTTKRYNDIEFRVKDFGMADLYFDHVELKEF